MTEVTTGAVFAAWMDAQTFAGPSEKYDAEKAFWDWLAVWGGPNA